MTKLNGQMSVEQALEIVTKEEQRREKKNKALKAWREKNKTKYNEYIKTWRAQRKLQVEAAKKILEASSK